MSLPATAFVASPLPRRRTILLIGYTVAVTVVFSLLLYQIVLQAARADAAKQKAAPTTEQPAQKAPEAPAAPAANPEVSGDSAATSAVDSPRTVVEAADSAATTPPAEKKQSGTDPRMISFVLIAITLAGGLGAALSNLRGVFEFTRENSGNFPAYLELPFYLRPVSGMLCGLFTFFLSTFFAGALSQADGAGWRTLDGMFPYIGIAFLAGFAAQEFMERLRDIARTVFGNSPAAVPVVPADPAQAPADPAQAPPVSGGGQESTLPEPGGSESTGGETRKSLVLPTQPPPGAPPAMTFPQKRAD